MFVQTIKNLILFVVLAGGTISTALALGSKALPVFVLHRNSASLVVRPSPSGRLIVHSFTSLHNHFTFLQQC